MTAATDAAIQDEDLESTHTQVESVMETAYSKLESSSLTSKPRRRRKAYGSASASESADEENNEEHVADKDNSDLLIDSATDFVDNDMIHTKEPSLFDSMTQEDTGTLNDDENALMLSPDAEAEEEEELAHMTGRSKKTFTDNEETSTAKSPAVDGDSTESPPQQDAEQDATSEPTEASEAESDKPSGSTEKEPLETTDTPPTDEKKADKESEPVSTDVVFFCVDRLYVKADKDAVTVRDIVRSVQDELSITVDKPLKKLIRSHLTDLITGAVQPAGVATVTSDIGEDESESESEEESEQEEEDASEYEDEEQVEKQAPRKRRAPKKKERRSKSSTKENKARRSSSRKKKPSAVKIHAEMLRKRRMEELRVRNEELQVQLNKQDQERAEKIASRFETNTQELRMQRLEDRLDLLLKLNQKRKQVIHHVDVDEEEEDNTTIQNLGNEQENDKEDVVPSLDVTDSSGSEDEDEDDSSSDEEFELEIVGDPKKAMLPPAVAPTVVASVRVHIDTKPSNSKALSVLDFASTNPTAAKKSKNKTITFDSGTVFSPSKSASVRSALRSNLLAKQRKAGNLWLARELGYKTEEEHLRDCRQAEELKRQRVLKAEEERLKDSERKQLRERLLLQGEDVPMENDNDDDEEEEYQDEAVEEEPDEEMAMAMEIENEKERQGEFTEDAPPESSSSEVEEHVNQETTSSFRESSSETSMPGSVVRESDMLDGTADDEESDDDDDDDEKTVTFENATGEFDNSEDDFPFSSIQIEGLGSSETPNGDHETASAHSDALTESDKHPDSGVSGEDATSALSQEDETVPAPDLVATSPESKTVTAVARADESDTKEYVTSLPPQEDETAPASDQVVTAAENNSVTAATEESDTKEALREGFKKDSAVERNEVVSDKMDSALVDSDEEENEFNDEETEKATEVGPKKPRNAAWKAMLAKEAENLKKMKKSRGGLVEGEAEEEEEEEVAGLEDFGFSTHRKKKGDDDDDAGSDKLDEDDLENIVDDVSDNEGDEDAGNAARKALEQKEEKERHKEILRRMRDGYDGRRGGIAGAGVGARGIHRFDQLVAADNRDDAKRLGLLNDDEIDSDAEGEKQGDDNGEIEDETALLDKMLKDRFLHRSSVELEENFSDDEEEEEEAQDDENAEGDDEEEKEQERLAKRFAKRARMQRLIEAHGDDEEFSQLRLIDEDESMKYDLSKMKSVCSRAKRQASIASSRTSSSGASDSQSQLGFFERGAAKRKSENPGFGSLLSTGGKLSLALQASRRSKRKTTFLGGCSKKSGMEGTASIQKSVALSHVVFHTGESQMSKGNTSFPSRRKPSATGKRKRRSANASTSLWAKVSENGFKKKGRR